MCTILFAYRQHPRYPLIVASNRDEELDRLSLPAAFCEDDPLLLAGRDAVEWGTWLGITKNGRFAALTNYRQGLAEDPAKVSRGQLVTRFLQSNDQAEEYVTKIKASDYNGFNLLVYDEQAMVYYSAQQDTYWPLEPGIYGLSNAHLNTPWPKVKKGTERLKEMLADYPESLPTEVLFELLADRERAKDSQLPDT